jgi:2-polyprenyl-3-methyl-5-hydroxy-6-metoxy-1,4-benzoquinol methylase
MAKAFRLSRFGAVGFSEPAASHTKIQMMLSETDLERFCRAIWPDLVGRPATAANQAKFALSRILPVINRMAKSDLRVLEVGAGSMLLSAYLASKGARVTALEPLTPDFSWFGALQKEVLAYCIRAGITFEHVESVAERYSAPDRYDFIFTIHVLEHMRDPLRALDNMYQSLKTPGALLAICPNYDVPFEPHLGILLVGLSKKFNGRLYARRVSAKSEVWDGLYFIRYSHLRRHLAEKNIKYAFSKNMVRDMFRQIGRDHLLYRRMPLFVRWSYRVIETARLTKLLSLMPARLQTPMELLIVK